MIALKFALIFIIAFALTFYIAKDITDLTVKEILKPMIIMYGAILLITLIICL